MTTIWTPERRDRALGCLQSWRSVRHAHRQASRRLGIDCIHLVYVAYEAAGILPSAKLGWYGPREGLFSDSDKLRDALQRVLHGSAERPGQPEFGDIALFQTGDQSAHCGFVTGPTLWHSLARHGVTESSLKLWLPRVKWLFRVTADGWRESPEQI